MLNISFFNNKIVIKIAGGLGNQLFQYALGRALSIDREVPLWLDISFFNDDPAYDRVYLLNQFNIHADKLLEKPYEQNYSWVFNQLVKYYRKFESKFIKKNKIFIDELYYTDNESESFSGYLKGEPYNRFFKNIFQNKSIMLILNGYWQSEKYFKLIENILRDDFKMLLDIPNSAKELSFLLQSKNSICIGIRQYSDSAASAGHYRLEADYYSKAIDIISERVTNPEFYVFTLEKDWVKENIKTNYPLTVIEPALTNETAYIDLYLMSQCKHFIIANSTYHWWGAWLGYNKDKIVVAPDKGWGNECAVPNKWIKI